MWALWLNSIHLASSHFRTDMSTFHSLRENIGFHLILATCICQVTSYPAAWLTSGTHLIILKSDLLTILTFCHVPSSYSPSQPTGLPAWSALSFHYFVKANCWASSSYKAVLTVRSNETWSSVMLLLKLPFRGLKNLFAISQGITFEHLPATKQHEPSISLEPDHLFAVWKVFTAGSRQTFLPFHKKYFTCKFWLWTNANY